MYVFTSYFFIKLTDMLAGFKNFNNNIFGHMVKKCQCFEYLKGNHAVLREIEVSLMILFDIFWEPTIFYNQGT